MGFRRAWSVRSAAWLPALLALVTATACGAGGTGVSDPTAPAEAVMSVRVPHPVPFRADYIITPVLLLPGDEGYPERCPTGPAEAATRATGEGQGTHLGRFTEMESDCVNFAVLSLTLGEFTFRAANGDRVRGEFEGSASSDPPPPGADLSCTWRITGGTGRFARATGAGRCVDSRQLGDGRSRIVFEGWIRYGAADRRDGWGMWAALHRRGP